MFQEFYFNFPHFIKKKSTTFPTDSCDRIVVGFTTTCAISAYQH